MNDAPRGRGQASELPESGIGRVRRRGALSRVRANLAASDHSPFGIWRNSPLSFFNGAFRARRES